jgi:Spy/CpxP family protein refolding chaperone
MTLFLSSGLFAQGTNEDSQVRRRLRQNINTLRMLRMTQALDLTEDQAAKIFPVINRVEREKARIQNQMSLTLRDLRQAVRQEPVDEARVQDLVQRVYDLRTLTREKEEELEACLDENLTPVQKGRYLLFSVDFFRGLNENLRRMRENTRPPVKRRS